MFAPNPNHVAAAPWPPVEKPRIVINDLRGGFGAHEVLKSISFGIAGKSLTAVMGPSGCGKSTFIRCINRLHEEIPTSWVTGSIKLDAQDVYAANVDPVELRRRIGMVFQRPNPFPTFSIFENVAAGLRLNGFKRRPIVRERVEQSLRKAALWDEVKDRLDKPGTSLSGGQQQRLCIARAIAVEPEVVLMDEPCSALDPIATAKIEELIQALKTQYTIVIVTHNMQQAGRVSDFTAFFYLGKLIEFGPTVKIFTNPGEKQTEDYITGRFG